MNEIAEARTSFAPEQETHSNNTEEQLKQSIEGLSPEIIEKVVKEVVPEIAERLIWKKLEELMNQLEETTEKS